jgi:hypothetical protein
MQTRFRAAATALLLTATAGLAATGGAAEASGTHHTNARATKTLTVKVTSTKKGPKLSVTRIRPGNTQFKVVRGNAGGSMQLLRLKSGYSLRQAKKDMGGVFSGDVAAVRSVDKHIVFYGGMDVPKKGAPANWWATNVDRAGTYYVVNMNNGSLATLKAKGAHQRRAMPKATSQLNVAPGNVWKSKDQLAHQGWMKTTNNAEEPHFVVLNQVQEGTTDQDVQDYIDAVMSDPQSGDQPPSWALPATTETNVISPGHSFTWKYGLPKGEYIAMCFWSSKVDGTPHFYMGMYKLFHLV